MNSIHQVRQIGQSVWLDYIRRGLIKSGELRQLIDSGITGLTANPTILEKAIIGSTDYDDELFTLARAGRSNEEIYESLAIEDIRQSADLLRPIYDRTGGADGYACLEIVPSVAYDTEGTISEGKRLFAAIARPNVMVKVPATPEGIPAIRQLTSEGINVNVTLIFSLDVYERVQEAYIAGLEDLVRKGGDPGRVASVASFFLSRIDTAVDKQLEERIKGGEQELKILLGRAAIASARLAYIKLKEVFYGQRFAVLKAGNARVQRLLWASTGTKNPTYNDVMYVEPLIGPDTVNTMPPATIQAFLDHGKAEMSIENETEEAKRLPKGLALVGIRLEEITDTLLADGVKAFADSFRKLISGIEEKRSRLLTTGEPLRVGTSLGGNDVDVEAALAKLTQVDIVRRIWRKDYTVWKPEPDEITDRLGWLNVTESMRAQVPALQSFADEVRSAGFCHVVLLGMGGSSLGAEVLRQVFGSAAGFPELLVLDSTVPASIQAVTDVISPEQTLFIVSSKSGTTTEPLILLRYFKSVLQKTDTESIGQHFAAITDAGTPLAGLAEKVGFRRVFLNPSDIGGRYSVLSYFGLVPATLMGIDIKALLDRADGMREACVSCVPGHHNPGFWLGACMGAMALKGRDKLTLVTSPSIKGFGLWIEQLIAESTGKDGKGIVPVAGEPLVAPAFYGSDRLFIYLRLKGDNNSTTDGAIRDISSSGQPVVVLDMKDRYDLGAEFFRCEFATAVAGALLGIHPFNQPNVQRAKDATDRLLWEYKQSKRALKLESTGSLSHLLSHAAPGKYFAIVVYAHQTREIDEALADLRQKVVERYHIATTLGYGPRFLHSTGQLHKGGPNSGLFLQITASHENDLPVPGEPYTFGIVADAQALGDLQALQALGRQVVTLHVPAVGTLPVRELISQINSA